MRDSARSRATRNDMWFDEVQTELPEESNIDRGEVKFQLIRLNFGDVFFSKLSGYSHT